MAVTRRFYERKRDMERRERTVLHFAHDRGVYVLEMRIYIHIHTIGVDLIESESVWLI